MSVDISVGRVLVKYRPSGGRVAAEWRPSGGEVSAGCRPTCLSVHVGRDAADTSVEYRSIYLTIRL